MPLGLSALLRGHPVGIQNPGVGIGTIPAYAEEPAVASALGYLDRAGTEYNSGGRWN